MSRMPAVWLVLVVLSGLVRVAHGSEEPAAHIGLCVRGEADTQLYARVAGLIKANVQVGVREVHLAGLGKDLQSADLLKAAGEVISANDLLVAVLSVGKSGDDTMQGDANKRVLVLSLCAGDAEGEVKQDEIAQRAAAAILEYTGRGLALHACPNPRCVMHAPEPGEPATVLAFCPPCYDAFHASVQARGLRLEEPEVPRFLKQGAREDQ
jgi:hypothetical protein